MRLKNRCLGCSDIIINYIDVCSIEKIKVVRRETYITSVCLTCIGEASISCKEAKIESDHCGRTGHQKRRSWKLYPCTYCGKCKSLFPKLLVEIY